MRKNGTMNRRWGLLVKVEDYRHSVPYSDRGKVPVEPLLSTQWFVKTEPLAARCREALEKQDPPLHSRALGEGVSRLAHRHPRLVHQPPALVGPSHPRLVRDQRDR